MIRIIVTEYGNICFNAQVENKPETRRRGETKEEAASKVVSGLIHNEGLETKLQIEIVKK